MDTHLKNLSEVKIPSEKSLLFSVYPSSTFYMTHKYKDMNICKYILNKNSFIQH